MKSKLLCILHCSPPEHGAAKVGDFISSSARLKKEFECRFITIKSSDTIGEIGKINFKKFYLVAELYMKILWMLLVFKPDKLYFTASISSIAFYRDLLISTLWKVYSYFTSLDVYYHYHTKGIEQFVSATSRNLKLTNFFIKDVNIILLSPLLEKDLEKVSKYKSILFLPNGVEDSIKDKDFDVYLDEKYKTIQTIQVLYLAHMMRDKGFLEVLELAKSTKTKNIHYHFAGAWKDEGNEKEFFGFIKDYELEKNITYHGFVSGKQKDKLFRNTNIFIYPSKNEAFGLAIIEALSYGVPIVATDEGSIPYILDEESGIVIKNLEHLEKAFDEAIEKLVNIESAKYCRKRYLDNFSLEQFEENLVRILK